MEMIEINKMNHCFSKEYLYYITWDKRYNFFGEKTFQEIIIDKYIGDVEKAIKQFLLNELTNFNTYSITTWIKRKGYNISSEDILFNICIIKNNYDLLVDIIGMRELDIK